MDNKKRKCKEKEHEALKLTNNSRPRDGDKFKFKKVFEGLPDDIDDLIEQAEEIGAQIECMSSDDDHVSILAPIYLYFPFELKIKLQNFVIEYSRI